MSHVITAVPTPANPLSRLEQLTNDIGSALEFLVTRLGPPPLKTLTVSPIPGTFGQGFPGLIYISTLAYLNPADRPMPLQTEANRLFFSELLHDHETAHQWWGNLVTSASYQDDWLMEALANYSALIALEKRKGRKTLEYVLDEYRQDLLKKDQEGEIIESAGPLIWGSRLQSSRDAAAWRPVVYEKGTWVVHMLRERMGDESFFKMLGEVVRQKRYAALTTEEFRAIAARFMPPKSEDASLENFFDSWVYNTGIPAVKVQWSVQGRAPKVQLKGTVTQSDVSDDFTTAVPIDIMLPTRKVVRHWVQTSGETTNFTIALPAPPAKVNADPSGAMLARR